MSAPAALKTVASVVESQGGDPSQIRRHLRVSNRPEAMLVTSADTEPQCVENVAWHPELDFTRIELLARLTPLEREINILEEKLTQIKAQRQEVKAERSWFSRNLTKNGRTQQALRDEPLKQEQTTLQAQYNKLKASADQLHAEIKIIQTKDEAYLDANKPSKLQKIALSSDKVLKEQQDRDRRVQGRMCLLDTMRNFIRGGFQQRRDAVLRTAENKAQEIANEEGFDRASPLMRKTVQSNALKSMYNSLLADVETELDAAKVQLKDAKTAVPWWRRLCRPSVNKCEIKSIKLVIKEVKTTKAELLTLKKAVTQESKRLANQNKRLNDACNAIERNRRILDRDSISSLWLKRQLEKNRDRLNFERTKLQLDLGPKLKFCPEDLSDEVKMAQLQTEAEKFEPLDHKALSKLSFAAKKTTTETAESESQTETQLDVQEDPDILADPQAAASAISLTNIDADLADLTQDFNDLMSSSSAM